MFCPKCGNTIPEGGKFCGSCGAAVQAATPDGPKKPVREKKKLNIKKIIVPVLCLVLLAGVILGVSSLFGKKTVYLASKTVSDGPSVKTTTKTEYDELGRIVSVKTTTKYHSDSMSGNDYTFQRDYDFDEDGKLVSVKIKSDGESDKLEYNYSKKGVLESIECNGEEAEVDCDKEGRITEISWEGGSVEYSYFKSGAIEEIEVDYETVAYSYVYDEEGHMLEQVTYIRNEKQSSTQSVYDKNGRLQEQTFLTYIDGKAASEITTIYHFDKSGLPDQIQLVVSEDNSEATLYLEAEDDGLRREFYIVDAEVDKAMLEDADVDDAEEFVEMLNDRLDGDPISVMEYDKQGNVVESSTMYNNSNVTYEYTAVKVPRDYRKPNMQEPLYFLPPIY